LSDNEVSTLVELEAEYPIAKSLDGAGRALDAQPSFLLD
jgi:hypothetical protein